MKVIAIAIVACFLLLGCLGSTVGKADYEALKANCEADKKGFVGEISELQEVSKEKGRQLASCQVQGATLQSELQKSQSSAQAMSKDYQLAQEARNKTGKIAAYENVRAVYLDAFGEGKIPNTARIRKIEDAILSIPDSNLFALLGKVKTCTGISDCGAEKAAFIGAIEGKEKQFKEEIVRLFSGK